MSQAMVEPIFDGLLNFRDFGGGEIVTGRLFRSAAHDRLSDDDIGQLAALGFGLVIDLRKSGERAAAPSRRHAAFCGTVIESVDNGARLPPHERYLAGDDLDFSLLSQRMAAWYVDAPFDPEHQELFRRGIEAVAVADAPIIVHCAAGKDRTGLFVMLLQHLLGVTPEAQLAEYLRTNADARLAEHLNARLIGSAAALGKRLDARAAAGLSGVTEACFRNARSAMAERHGSIDGYLAAIGLAEGTRGRLRARYRVQIETKTSSSATVTG